MDESRVLLVCVNRRLGLGAPSCAGRGSERLAERLEQRLAERGLNLELRRIHCFGECERGPNLRLTPGGHLCISRQTWQKNHWRRYKQI